MNLCNSVRLSHHLTGVYEITLPLVSHTNINTSRLAPVTNSHWTHLSLYPKQRGGAGATYSAKVENNRFWPGSVSGTFTLLCS